MDRALRRRPSPGALVDAILDDDALVAAVPELDPGTLGALVRRVGLADAGELLALASGEQLRALSDDALWRNQAAGAEEALDGDAFATWLEVLRDADPRAAVAYLADLDPDVLAHALGQRLLVLELDGLALLMATGAADDGFDPELIDKALESSLSAELDRYLLVATAYDGWDALIDTLVDLDVDHHDRVVGVLDRLSEACADRIADDGLYQVLTASESLAEDASAGRDDRRAARGFVAPRDAAAFLAGARRRAPSDLAGAAADPILRGFHRAYQPVAAPLPSESGARLTEVLRDAGVTPSAQPLLPPAGAHAPVRAALAELRRRDPALHTRQLTELLFVANALVAGHDRDGRRYALVEAMHAALGYADAGAVWLVDAGHIDDVEAALADHGVAALFAAGWNRAADR